MVNKTLSIAYYEARMSSRGWRFWLLLALMTAISLFARRDYLAARGGGFFLHTAFGFQHPSFGLMLAVIYLGALFLSLDTCGRVCRTGMDKILYPLPLGAMELTWGRFLGVLLMMIPLSGVGLFTLGIWQQIYGHGYVVWQPFIAAFFLLVLPVIVPMTAVAITMRTLFKHDLAALLSGALFLTILTLLGNKIGIVIDFADVTELLMNASPTLGVRIVFGKYVIPLSAQALISITVLYLAPLYLRRQEPQRVVISRTRRYSILNIPTLRRWLANLRFDSHLGWAYRLSLIFWLVVCTSGALWATYRYQETLAQREEWDRLTKSALDEEVTAPGIDVQRYDLDITPASTHDHIAIDATLTFRTTQETPRLGLDLNPLLEVDSVELDKEKSRFSRRMDLLKIDLSTPIPAGEEHRLTIRYHGECSSLCPTYSYLEGKWYPEPWIKMQTQSAKRWLKIQDDLFEAEITLHMQPGQFGAFAGNLVFAVEKDGRRVERWRTWFPVNTLQIYWGRYEYIEAEKPGYRIRFYHLPSHAYQAQVYLEEIKEQEEYVVEKLGRLPFPQLTLIELPYEKPKEVQKGDWRFGMWGRWRGSSEARKRVSIMPGLLTVSENQLVYMNERMWLIERLDHDPRTIPFYQQLRPTLRYLHEQFYDSLISVYFDQTLHPTGDLAFWLRDYLSGYASKLLEQNPWRRKEELNFDIGARSDLPASIAQQEPLLAMHQEGQYPALEQIRGEGLFRMIHHLLGEEKWWKCIQEVSRDFRFQELPVGEFLKRVETGYGGDFSWFVQSWVQGTALPEYEITFAEAKMSENKKTNRREYDVSIRVKNHGTGRMSVPIFLETETDYIFRDLWLDTGEEGELKLVVPQRPTFAAVDPENWVLQQPFYDPIKKIRNRSEKRVYIVGDETTKNRSGSGGRSLRDRRGGGGGHPHFW